MGSKLLFEVWLSVVGRERERERIGLKGYVCVGILDIRKGGEDLTARTWNFG